MPLRPAMPIVLCYCAGILAARFLGANIPVLLGLAGAVVSIFVLSRKYRFQVALLAFLFLGWLNYAWRFQVHDPEDVRTIVGHEEAIVQARGCLLITPELRQYKTGSELYRSTSARLRLNAVQLHGEWQPAIGDLAVVTRGTVPQKFWAGQEVLITGVIKEPARGMARGMFDFRRYLYHQRIFYQLTVESARDWAHADAEQAHRKPMTVSFQEWAQPQLTRGLPGVDANVELIWSMVLGWKTGFTQEVAEPFMKTGTIHIFAISGLHVVCIVAMFVGFLRFAGLPRHLSAWSVIPFMWFYTVATGWQSSAVRSAIMSSVLVLGWAMRRPSDLLNSLAIAALLVLGWQPEQLFQASFQLSFAVVTSIALWLPLLERINARVLQPDPLLPPELRPKWQQNLHAPIRFVTTNFIISLASWLGAIPITAAYFNLVTPVTLLANLFIVPLSSVSLIASAWAILVPFAAPVFNYFAWAFMGHVIWVNDLLSNIGYFYVPKPTPAFFLFYYICFLSLVTKLLFRATWRLPLAALIALSTCAWAPDVWSGMRRTEITMLPIKGTPIYISGPGSEPDLLVDCSDEYGAERFLKPFLRGQGINRLDQLVLTHGDINHVEGYRVMEKEFKPLAVVTSSAPFRSSTYRKVARELASIGNRYKRVNRGDTFEGWKVLHPPAGDKSARADDKALVLRKEISGVTLLLMSDLGSRGRSALLNAYPELRADIVIVGVPEQGEPVTAGMIEHLNPQLVIIGTVQSARQATAPAWQKELESLSMPVWLTSEAGAVTLRFERAGCIAESRDGRQIELKKRP